MQNESAVYDWFCQFLFTFSAVLVVVLGTSDCFTVEMVGWFVIITLKLTSFSSWDWAGGVLSISYLCGTVDWFRVEQVEPVGLVSLRTMKLTYFLC